MKRSLITLMLILAFGQLAEAIPVTYSYTGAPYDWAKTPQPPDPQWFIVGVDHMVGIVTLDVPLGTAGVVSMICTTYPNALPCLPVAVGTTTHGGMPPFMFTDKNTSSTLIFRANVFVDEAGDVLEGSLSVEDVIMQNWIGATPTGSSASFALGSFPVDQAASTSKAGAWVKQSVPEPSALLLLVAGLAMLAVTVDDWVAGWRKG